MSTITNLLSSALTSDNISTLAGRLGIENAQAKKALGLALPALIKGLEKNSATPEGASSLDNALAKDHNGSLMENISSLLGDTSTEEGAKITGHILGDHTEAVTQMIAEKSGLDTEKASLLIKKLSPVVMWALGKAKKEGNLSASDLTGVLSGESAGIGKFLGNMLDQDGDGDFDISDALKIGMNFLKK